MNLDQNAKDAVQNLSNAINSAVEKSFDVRDAIESLRELGYEPVLTLKLEIGLQEREGKENEFADHLELDLTDEDVRTLQRMKIKF